MLLVGKESEVASQEQEIFQLAGRACGEVKKLAELRPAASGAFPCDIDGHRGHRSPRLTRNCESFTVSKGPRCALDSQCQRMALLPHLKLFKILHLKAPLTPTVCIYLQQIANDCPLSRGNPC
jgi:hypothetical protein